MDYSTSPPPYNSPSNDPPPRYTSPLTDPTQHGTSETAQEMEARMRQVVVASRRKREKLCENNILRSLAAKERELAEEIAHYKAQQTCAKPRSTTGKSTARKPLSKRTPMPTRRPAPAGKPNSTGNRRYPYIYSIRTFMRSLKKSGFSVGMGRWPQTDPQSLIIDISDDEDEDMGTSNAAETPVNRLQVITNRS